MSTVNVDHLKALLNLDWTKIKHFYYIAKLGSFTKAAQFLNSTQPGLSRQIKLLETELNCTLFYRGARGVILTRKGEELFKVVEKYFFELKGFNFNHITMSEHGEKRKIRIAASPGIAAYVLNEHMLAYKITHPEIIFEIIAIDTQIDMAINDIDIMIGPHDPNLQGVEQKRLFTFEKKLYASPNYIKQYGEPQSVEELDKHHLIVMTSSEKAQLSDLNWILRLGMSGGQLREPAIISNSMQFVFDAAVQGHGIISSYDEMSIIKKSNLRRILSNLEGPKIEDYIYIQSFLKDDLQVVNIKNYLLDVFIK